MGAERQSVHASVVMHGVYLTMPLVLCAWSLVGWNVIILYALF